MIFPKDDISISTDFERSNMYESTLLFIVISTETNERISFTPGQALGTFSL